MNYFLYPGIPFPVVWEVHMYLLCMPFPVVWELPGRHWRPARTVGRDFCPQSSGSDRTTDSDGRRLHRKKE